MKKILFVAAACVALASCSKEEIVSVDKGAAIGFDTFVENSTRTKANDINKDNLSQFSVYGSVVANNHEGFIFNDQKVTKNGDAYTYSPIQYWVPGADYKFSAFASLTSTQTVDRQWSFEKGANAANGVIAFNNEAAEADQDLVYAYRALETASTITSAPAPVGFTFNHMLSRVKFTITNGFTAGSNIKLDITNLTITNAHSNGRLAIENGEPKAWAVTANTFARNFGSTTQLADNDTSWTTEHYYLIPADGVYNVTFDVTLWQAGVEVDTYSRTATVDLDMDKGKSYNIKATLNSSNTSDDGSEIYHIEFTVDAVEDWKEFGDVDATVTEPVSVATAAELEAAIANGGNITLTEDIDLDAIATTRATFGLFIEKDCVINGEGHTITSTSDRAIAVSGANAVTLKNFTLEATGERGIQVQDGAKNVTIENVTATAYNYTVNLPSSAGATVVTINNCDLKGLNTVNIAAPGANVTINDTTLRCEDNAAEAYGVVSMNPDAVGAKAVINRGEVIITGTNTEGTNAGCISAANAEIIFNDTVGNCTVDGHSFAINYANGYAYTFATFEGALSYAKDGETITLLKDVNLTEPVVITKEVIVDLNGKNITADTFLYPGNTEVEDSYAFWVKNGGDLTINGEGEISTTACKYSIAVWAQGGNVTINGGTFQNAGEGSDLIYASANGHVVINGGVFNACEKQNGVAGTEEAYSALNLKGDGTGSSITCYGGRFFKFDPANNKSENPAVSFVATGYKSVADGDYFEVVAE